MSSIIIRQADERFGTHRPIVRIPERMTRSEVDAHPDGWAFEIGWCEKVIGGWAFGFGKVGSVDGFASTLAEVRAIAEDWL